MDTLNDPESVRIFENSFDHFKFLNDVLYVGSEIEKDSETNNFVVRTTQNIKINPIRQDILRHLKAYKIGINLIKDSIYMMEDDKIPCVGKIEDLLRMSFIFLRNFVTNNIVNQNILSEYLVGFTVNMTSELGQVDLFCEIFRNNKKICLEKHEEITDDFFKLIRTNGRKARFLEFFEILQKCGSEYLISNQKMVLNLFFDPKNKTTFLYMKEDGNKDKIKRQIFE